MFGRYKPFKDLIHYENWRQDGTLYADRTNSTAWYNHYNARRYHYNIPSDENMYDIRFLILRPNYGEVFWALNEDYT